MTRDRWYWCIRDEDQRVIVMNLARPESEWQVIEVLIDGEYRLGASGDLADRLVDALNGPSSDSLYRREIGAGPDAVIVEENPRE